MSQQYGPPTPFTERDWARRADLFDLVLTWTLAFSGAIVAIYAVVLIFWYSNQFLLLLLSALFLVITCLVVRALVRRGHLNPAIYLHLTVLLVSMSVLPLIVAEIMPIVGTFYIVVIILAGILLGFRASFVIAALAGVLYVILAILGRYSFTVPQTLNEDWSVMLTSFLSILTFLSVAYLAWLTTRDLRRSLQDATYDLEKTNEELTEANRLKTHFLARVSHELRTPLNSIIGYTDMNLAGVYGELNVAQRDGLERVQRNGRQLLRLINDVLDLSHIEAGELKLQEGVVNPEALVRAVVTTVEPQAQKKGLALSYELDPALPPALLGDEARLNQILLNLVDNAVKFTDQGSVHVAAQVGAANTWVLQVRDTGRGISEREVTYIFEEFRQGEGAYDRKTGGVGLGLAIVRRLTEAMGGTVSVQSRLGTGSTFTVTLPMNPISQPAEAQTP